MPGTLRRLAVTSVSRERLWARLSTAEGLSCWLGDTSLVVATGRRGIISVPGLPGTRTEVHVEVLEVVPEERIVLAWRTDALDTTVTFAVSPFRDEFLRLDVTHAGFRGLRGRMTARSAVGPAWTSALRRLVNGLT